MRPVTTRRLAVALVTLAAAGPGAGAAAAVVPGGPAGESSETSSIGTPRDLRSPDARDAAQNAAGAAPDLRSPDARDAANDYRPVLSSPEPSPTITVSDGGFDWVSASIGAATAAGGVLLVLAVMGTGRLPRRPAVR